MVPSVQSERVNAPGGSPIHNSSKFNLSYLYGSTYLFGLIKPCHVSDVVPRDKSYRLHSGHDARSFNLKAPLMQNVNMYKAHISVPMDAILPLNWNKWFNQPVIGEDVPADCGCGVENFTGKMRAIFLSLAGALVGNNAPLPYSKEYLQAFLRLYQFGSLIYSNGSLISSLGAHFGNKRNCRILCTVAGKNRWLSFDRLMETCLMTFNSRFTSFTFHFIGETKVYTVTPTGEDENAGATAKILSLREFLWNYLYDGGIVIDTLNISNSIFDDITVDGLDSWEISDIAEPYNISRLWAYQLACAHFFTNDKIDYVFSAELFRQLIGHYVCNTSVGLDIFTVNGIQYQYDYLSSHFFNIFINQDYPEYIDYFLALFSFRHSLKFMDYFTGSRTKPLAMGDVYQDVDVQQGQGSFNVIDLAHNTWSAKFRQFLMRYGSKAKSYIKGVFGIEQAYDYHDPCWLGKTRDRIYSVETDNTASEQLSEPMTTTAQFRSNGDRYAFEFNADRDTIIVSVIYFDIDRLYVSTIDRQLFAIDRFDYFNPWTQFLGDQPIYAAELVAGGAMQPFSYTNRNQEYKTRINQADGGFVEFLPGWAFLADDDSPTELTPRFIRSSPTELDRFYNSLTYFSPAGYFHFIIKNDNTITAIRPMAFNPIVSF